MVAGAVLIPPSLNYMVFRVVLAALGVFVILFGQGARIPAIMVAIYGFVITFPIVLEKLAGDAYAYSALAPLLWLGNGLGYGIQNHGQWIAFTSARGELISAAVTISCAGSATMGIFIALFALMMLDRPLPRQRAIVLFLFGAIGTWLQNIIRLVILIVAGYYLGNAALWTAHYWTIYILFPVWYLLFTFIYFRQFKKPGAGGKQPGELEFKMAMGR